MLKVKDNVDLKELEKFGFLNEYKTQGKGQVYVSCCETIEFFGYETGDDKNDGLTILYNLIKADLIEKVDE